jgi:hypothetical protein
MGLLRAAASLTVASGLSISGPGYAGEPVKVDSSIVVTPSDWTVDQEFGSRVAVYADLVAVSAAFDSVSGGTESVYIFRHVPGGLVEESKIVASGAPGKMLFGSGIALGNDILFVGAVAYDVGPNNDNSGAVYVFERIGGIWTQTALITVGPSSHFGSTICWDGTTLAVSAPEEPAVYVFLRVGGQWNMQQRIPSPVSPPPNQQFGWQLCCEGKRMLVGNPVVTLNGIQTGAVYSYIHSGGSWTLQGTLDAQEPVFQYGSALAMDGDYAVASVPINLNPLASSGASLIHVYNYDGTAWVKSANALFKDKPYTSNGGSVVALRDGLLVTSDFDDFISPTQIDGRVQSFLRKNDDWVHHAYLEQAVPSGQSFTTIRSVAIGEGFIVTGDPKYGYVTGSSGNWGRVILREYHKDWVPYSMGCPGSGGIVPELAGDGSASPGSIFELKASNGVGGGLAVFVVGTSPYDLNAGYGCTLHVWAPSWISLGPWPLVPFGAQAPGAGSLTLPFLLPASIPLTDVYLQMFVLDGGVSGGFCASNAVRIDFHD